MVLIRFFKIITAKHAIKLKKQNMHSLPNKMNECSVAKL